MYQLVSCLPDEVQFTCRVCSIEKPAYWEKVLKAEFSNGLSNVLNALMSSKCAQMLLEAGPPVSVYFYNGLTLANNFLNFRNY